MSDEAEEQYAHIQRELDRYGYLERLEFLAKVLDDKLWIVGGWVRSAFLNQSEYAGDIDCLCTLSDNEITTRLSASSISTSRNRNDGIRIQLFDKNHVDIIPVEHFAASGAIEDVLGCFNFSVNSAAFRIGDGHFRCTRTFFLDIEARSFRLNDRYSRKNDHRKALFEDAEGLLYHYRLTPGTHKPTSVLLAEIAEEKKALRLLPISEKFDRARGKIREVLGVETRAWVVRGYVRCSLLASLEYWDDLDVVVDLNRKDLRDSIERQGHRYLENYFGNPKIFLADGTTIDLWSLPDRYLIKDELYDYSHNVDALAWHVDSGVLEDPLDVGLTGESLEVEVMAHYFHRAPAEELAYTAFKTAYLCLRHNLKPGPRARKLLNMDSPMNGFLKMNVARLSKELSCATEGKVSDPIESLKSEVGNSPVLDSILKCCTG